MRLILILSLLLGLMACQDSDSEYDTGTILGFDARMCGCCGGCFININDSLYRFEPSEIPEGRSDVQWNKALPIHIKVLVAWRPKEHACIGDEITVTYLHELKP